MYVQRVDGKDSNDTHEADSVFCEEENLGANKRLVDLEL